MNVFHTTEQNRDEVLLKVNSSRITTSIVLLCGAILAFILPATASALAEQTRPLGNKDKPCVMQEIRVEASSARDPENSTVYPVEPYLWTQNHVDASFENIWLLNDTPRVLNTHLYPFLPERLLETHKIRNERYSQGHHKIFVEQQGPMPRVIKTWQNATSLNRLNSGIGTLKGTHHVQINAPEYPAG